MPGAEHSPRFITAAEYADRYGVPDWQVIREVREGRFRGEMRGRVWYVEDVPPGPQDEWPFGPADVELPAGEAPVPDEPAGGLPTTSRIQVGTRGRYQGRSFSVTGRVAYSWGDGAWSEWHLRYADGVSGWLSDADEQYAVYAQVPDPGPLPPFNQLQPEQRVYFGGRIYVVDTVLKARCEGTEGALPFEMPEGQEALFADLTREDGRPATLDYTEAAPLLFAGEVVRPDDLALSGLREDEQRWTPRRNVVRCPQCGNGVAVRAPELTQSVVCGTCGSMLDLTGKTPKVLDTVQKGRFVPLLIPLGARGTLHGAEYQVIGFERRSFKADGETYSWTEYLLYHPGKGVRFLTEYEGHWNDVITLRTTPSVNKSRPPVATLFGEKYRHFQSARVNTTFVIGEFPWKARLGGHVAVNDYVAPPRVLSKETSGRETTWSLGEYVSGAHVWKAFNLPGEPPRARGVYANQPSRFEAHLGSMWKTFAGLAVLLLLFWVVRSVPRQAAQRVYDGTFAYAATGGDWAAPGDSLLPADVAVSDPMELRGRTANLEVRIDTDISNSWVYFNFALMNVGTGRVVEFGREVSYYYGYDGGESWREGSQSDDVLVPSVPPGRYVLRIAPEGPVPVQYRVTLRRDVPNLGAYGIALLLLLIPPAFVWLRARSIDRARWAESDYPPDE